MEKGHKTVPPQKTRQPRWQVWRTPARGSKTISRIISRFENAKPRTRIYKTFARKTRKTKKIAPSENPIKPVINGAVIFGIGRLIFDLPFAPFQICKNDMLSFVPRGRKNALSAAPFCNFSENRQKQPFLLFLQKTQKLSRLIIPGE